MHLGKTLKKHALLQTICRTNRLFPNKTFGGAVGYCGLFDDTAAALAFDEESVKKASAVREREVQKSLRNSC